ncbi:hypothetical protein ACTXT7_016782 [Hymenolepis weldensis]
MNFYVRTTVSLLKRRADYKILATQLSNYADIEVQISSIVGNTFTQMNFSTTTKDPKGYEENVKLLQHSILNTVIFIITSWQISPTPHELPRCFVNLIDDYYLCSSHYQLMDPVDLTYEKIISKLGAVVSDNNLTISEDENVHYHVGIVNRLGTSFRLGFIEENQIRYLIFILGLRFPCHTEIRLRLLSLLDKKPDVRKSRRRPESTGGLLTASVQLKRT